MDSRKRDESEENQQHNTLYPILPDIHLLEGEYNDEIEVAQDIPQPSTSHYRPPRTKLSIARKPLARKPLARKSKQSVTQKPIARKSAGRKRSSIKDKDAILENKRVSFSDKRAESSNKSDTFAELINKFDSPFSEAPKIPSDYSGSAKDPASGSSPSTSLLPTWAQISDRLFQTRNIKQLLSDESSTSSSNTSESTNVTDYHTDSENSDIETHGIVEIPPLLALGPPPPNMLRINVSGKIFDISEAKLRKFPDSIFWSSDMENYYRADLDVYFFDRSRLAFEYIFRYIYSDAEFVEFPEEMPAELLEMELEFYKLGWRYFLGTFRPIVDHLDFKTVHEKGFAFFNYPEWSRCAQWYVYMDLFFILISIFQFMMETDPDVRRLLTADETGQYLRPALDVLTWILMVFFTGDILLRFIFSLDRVQFITDYTVWLDIIAVVPFYLDLLMRPPPPSGPPPFADSFNQTAPPGPPVPGHNNLHHKTWQSDGVVPQTLSAFLSRNDSSDILSNTTRQVGGSASVDSDGFVNIMKVARISRCLKVIRRSEKLLMILNILAECVGELGVLMFAWILGVIISGTVLYYAEHEIPIALNGPNATYYMSSHMLGNGTCLKVLKEWYYSQLESYWQAVVLIGTVGYGDTYPMTALGKSLSSIIIFATSVFMATPMTLIIKRFSKSYEGYAKETRIRKVFGSKFEGGKMKQTMEERVQSPRVKLIWNCVERHRSNETSFYRLKRRFVQKFKI